MIKVLQVTGGMNRAGAETMLMNIYRCMDRTQVQFDFIVYDSLIQDYEEEIISLGGKVFHLDCKPGWRMILSINKIRDILRENGPYKAIHVHTLFNSVYALIAATIEGGVLKLTHSHSTKNSAKKSLLKKVYEIGSKLLIGLLSDVMLACGNDAGRYLFGNRFITHGAVIKNGIILNNFASTDQETILNLKNEWSANNDLIIGSVARFEPVKNHKFMIDIACELKARNINFKLVMAGVGSILDDIKRKVIENKLTDNVVFLGCRSDVEKLLHAFDVFLMPSLFEGTPVALIEAQGTGLPCLISSCISSECNLGLGLIKRLSLNVSISQWCDLLTRHNRKHIHISQEEKEEMFEIHGYNVSSSAQKLHHLYLQSQQ